AWVFLQERIRGLQWFAIGLSVVGLLFILEPLNMQGTIASKLLAMLAGVSWAAGSIVAKKLREKVELDLLSLTAWQTVFGAIPLVVIALLVPSQPIVWSAPFIGALVYNVIPGTAIAMLLWLFVLNRLSAGTAGLGMLMTPVVGVLAAWLQLGEQPGLTEAIGMVLILAALVLNSLQALRQ
ncbi:EamA family transporter, partial [Leptolyngbya sp. FACHB-36]|uniref:DMT family transporter n=1 Tax=Leptolyngbya sp. FACHB-36 TaxID=2692808 RepID=UPI001681B595